MKNMTTTRSFLAVLTALLLALMTLAPLTAHASGTEKAIQLGSSGISGYDSTNGYDYIYYGEWDGSPIKWRVLATKTNTGGKGLFLLSDVLLGTVAYGDVCFQQSYHQDTGSGEFHKGGAPANGDHSKCRFMNAYQGSDGQGWCSDFYNGNLTEQEQKAILATTKDDGTFTSSTYLSFAASGSILNEDKVFFLSAEEAKNANYGFNTDSSRIADYGSNAGWWWLRSPCVNLNGGYDTGAAGLVRDDGTVDHHFVHDGGAHPPRADRAVRPAFNLDLGSVLFTSAAVGGSSAGGEIFEIPETATKEWKLTLKDDSRAAFSASMTAASAKEVTFSWEGAKTGRDEWISAVIMDADGNVKYYGRIAQPKKAKGTATVKMPRKLGKTDRLWVFNEQYNGDKKTDYASPLVELAALPDGTVGVKYKSQELKATELTAPLEWKLVKKTKKDRLPAGLKLSRVGKISGTPREAGTFAFTVQVTDASGKSATKALLLTVEKGGGPAAPEGLVATPPTAQGMTDGTINGVDPTMEWSADDGETWTDCPATGPITGLAPGDYLVRYKATEKAGPGDAATVTVPESGAHVVTVRLIDGGDGGPVVVLELTSDGGPVAGRDLWAWLVPVGDGKEQGAFLGTTDEAGRLVIDVDALVWATGDRAGERASIPAGTWRIRIEIHDADGDLWTGVSSDTVSLPATSTRSGGGCFNVGFGGLAMMALAGAATRRRR